MTEWIIKEVLLIHFLAMASTNNDNETCSVTCACGYEIDAEGWNTESDYGDLSKVLASHQAVEIVHALAKDV